ncbi:hypothetical protein V8T50_03460 [Vibrio parahaemolyticus]|uniref:hypothetical protein n=1 Tax=Vibrio parahaemolyticus TaxID=670 RepID=UPI00177C9C85|nr:hypothetical protein [Vibrio parahaemolyticus]MBD6983492.1 hypothetical protein [Vibrio parahaemolyticus]MBD6986755.1 hypothetical protein [Vibrio parahaemolyticus]
MVIKKNLLGYLAIAVWGIYLASSKGIFKDDIGFESDGYSRSLEHGNDYRAHAVGVDAAFKRPVVSIEFPDKSCKQLSYSTEPRVYSVNGKKMRFDSSCIGFHSRIIVSAFSVSPRLSSYFLNEKRVTIVIEGEEVSFSTKNFEQAIQNSENKYK